ncbi:unnamed protein product [Lactuca virosa]|uniref:glucose-6-phosphate 1-epimerase n=1 Tax=Lactuca virosa TaxID=75947 RepID=A0AAU9N4D3_9ASTR|nr:unnamed protein product [Lactuca virosa]
MRIQIDNACLIGGQNMLLTFSKIPIQTWEHIKSPEDLLKTASVEITKGINGLDKLVLRQIRGSTVEVYLYGAHVTSWKNDHGKELLFLSSKAIFSPPTAIRGGIPIIFPQFSNLGPLRSHGFARNRVWTMENNSHPLQSKPINGVFVDLLLKPTEDDLNIWPNRFEYRLRITLGLKGDLIMTSRIKNTNTDKKQFNFTFAYHNYFRVSNISEVRVEGLGKLDYLDNTQNRTRFTETRNVITINSEIDRIYLSTPKKLAILDHKKKQTISIQKHGLPDAVVWNPWEERSKTIVDLGPDDYKSMVAVEASAIGKPVILNSGQEWKAVQKLSDVTSH